MTREDTQLNAMFKKMQNYNGACPLLSCPHSSSLNLTSTPARNRIHPQK